MSTVADEWTVFFHSYWPHIAAVITIGLQCFTAGHAILNKRDSRSAIGWVGLIWLAPLVGATLYAMFGINRIRRKARSLRGDPAFVPPRASSRVCTAQWLEEKLGHDWRHLRNLSHMIGEVTQLPLLCGNRITPLVHGSRAYPAMLEAIGKAEKSIALSTYIFNSDAVGDRFATALEEAVRRGVQVRVLVDDIGSRYKLPPILWRLHRNKVPAARFLPALVPVFLPYSNLRSHRKIMVIDGQLGFTGGMNIRECGGETHDPTNCHAMMDLHFKVGGPIIDHLARVFADDWEFTTHEHLTGDLWRLEVEPCGEVLARGIAAGPDEDRDKLRLSLLGALACARRAVKIVTPYFLPDSSLITALGVARLRGVEIDILLPQVNNLKTVQWACDAQLWQVLEYGCRVWLTRPPFDHTKLMLVDDVWTLMGSGNWDARSLRLNFEFDVECYDSNLHQQMEQLVADKLRGAKQMTLADMDARPLPIRLRDGVARLFSPYL
ncbi:MAG TPA: phospholipase D-like domain-containing protein [Pirellulales bacterium]|jgi:cardiolipin synthase|nr:phospholipase D-like domain-containing protein [Pirellulales bacterium]